MLWNYYKLRQLSLLQSAMTVITNCDTFFITKCDTVYYKLLQSAMIITNCDSTAAMDSCFALLRAHQHSIAVGPLNGQSPFRIKGPVEFWSLDILFVSKQPIRILH